MNQKLRIFLSSMKYCLLYCQQY